MKGPNLTAVAFHNVFHNCWLIKQSMEIKSQAPKWFCLDEMCPLQLQIIGHLVAIQHSLPLQGDRNVGNSWLH